MAADIACGLTVHATIVVSGVAVALLRLPLLRTALQWQPLRSRYERYAGLINGIFGLVLAALAIRLMIGW
jgi:threonine/homoserine/homoserine lactone efflux protein